MFSMWKWILDSFWTESLWLGSDIKWTDVTNGPHKSILYPDSTDFYYHIMLMVVVLCVKYTMERYCYEPIGRVIGIKDKKQRKVENIPQLETAYRKSPTQKDMTALTKQLDMSERQVERWWRLRKNMDKPTRLIKFREHAWRVTYFGCNSLCGLYILWDKDYFWDLDKCYVGYPHQGVMNDEWWFYTVNIASTWLSLVTVFSDVRRADFVPMVVHHVITVTLLNVSWMSSFYRIGIVLLPMLDGSEALLELCKASKAANYENVLTFVFCAFTLVWVYVRVYLYPFHILHSVIIRVPMLISPSFAYNLLVAMLLILFVLQSYWTVLIIQTLYNFFTYGIVNDVRSSESESSDCQLIDGAVNSGRSNLHKNDSNGHNIEQLKSKLHASGQ